MTTAELAVILGVAVIAALIKSTTGMGYPLIVVPALALFIDVIDALVVVAPANLVLNALLVRKGWSHRGDAQTLNRFLAGGVVGAIGGSLAAQWIPDAAVRVILVGVIVAFVVGRHREVSSLTSDRAEMLAIPVGAVAGVFQGAAGISGPIVSPWFLRVGLSRDPFVYAIATAFALTGALQIGVFAVSGLFVADLIFPSLAQIPIALAMAPVGARLREAIPVDRFEQIVVMILAASAISLVARML